MNDILKVGQSIEIREYGLEKAPKYRAKIHDIKKEILEIEIPVVGSGALSMRSGTLYEIIYYKEDSVFTQKVEVETRFMSGAIVCARLLLRGQAKKINRRKYFRLPVLVEGYSRGGRKPFSEMTTTNLSAGGIRFVTLEKYKAGQYIQIRITLGEDTLDLLCKVIQCNHVKDSIRRYDVRAKFEKISTREEDLILGYLFEQQRVMKRKGLA